MSQSIDAKLVSLVFAIDTAEGGLTTVTAKSDVYYDPYDVEIGADPYPVFQRLREEAPLYYNEEHDFYALSRYEDNHQALLNPKAFSSSRGDILEIIQANMEIPPGTFIFEDDPAHAVHRGLLSRVFTPKRMLGLEPQMREFCARSLDPLVGGDRIDFVADLGAQMPMRVIGMLLGIPEEHYETVRGGGDDWFNTEPGQKMSDVTPRLDELEEYLDWRIDHPSDDLTTQLLTTEFEDETGTVRCLSRDEALSYINLLAIAGNETTGRLIGWTGKLLSDHPDQRRELAENPSLIPNAIEEVLKRFPDWEVDMENARLGITSTVRGWETLPAVVAP